LQLQKSELQSQLQDIEADQFGQHHQKDQLWLL